MSGRIFQLNRSGGGVPKVAVDDVVIGTLGLEGDRQKHLKIHGGPERAVCVYSLEVIHALQAEGHTIYPGASGENVTVSGLEWNVVEPGSRLSLGDTVVLEVTRYTEPCKQIAGLFIDRVFRRIDQDKNPGWSRVYAKVIHGGTVRVGQTVELR